MTRDDLLTAIGRDSAGFADAAAAADLATPVPACPGWDVAELVWHLLGVHYFWRSIAAGALQDPREVAEPDRPADAELVGAFRDGAAALMEVLAATDPATPVWTWAPQKDVAFIVRHQAQETAVHRWDAEQAAGRGFAIDAPLASDSIDEFLAFSFPSANEGAALAGSVHLHCTDVPGEWLVAPAGEGNEVVVTREHAKGDAALRGTASDLLLALYRRAGLDTLDVVGDRAAAEAFIAYPDLD
jgi:uncharacterized protein (TIGR03083 family)